MHLITGGDRRRRARIPDARPTIHLIISNILSKGGVEGLRCRTTWEWGTPDGLVKLNSGLMRDSR
eukprot:5168393-Pyramimonas_sp.AAC.1